MSLEAAIGILKALASPATKSYEWIMGLFATRKQAWAKFLQRVVVVWAENGHGRLDARRDTPVLDFKLRFGAFAPVTFDPKSLGFELESGNVITLPIPERPSGQEPTWKCDLSPETVSQVVPVWIKLTPNVHEKILATHFKKIGDCSTGHAAVIRFWVLGELKAKGSPGIMRFDIGSPGEGVPVFLHRKGLHQPA